MKKGLQRTFFTTLLCCALASNVFSQNISGTVISQKDNTGISGVTIKVKETSVNTTSDKNGNFSIKANTGQTLLLSSIGFQPQQILIRDQNSLQIRMEEDYSKLNDVVVVGYGTARKKDLSGSVASLSGEEIKSAPITSFEQGLQGRVAGVQVVQGNSAPGGAPQVRIRGANTVLGGNEPLYVIDGVPVYNSTLLNQDGLNVGTQPSNALASINPNDIVSMEVLKDASATAIYGARGANGVVIITTRRGKSSDKGKIIFESYYGTQQISNKLDLMNSAQFIALSNEKAQNLGTALPFPNVDSSARTDTDWQDVLFRTAPMQNYSLSFSGGTAASQYNISANWFDQKGVLLNSDFKRGSLRINLDNRINERFKVATSITASRSINNRPLNYWLSTAMSTSPTISPYDSAGNFKNLLTIPNVGIENPIEGLLKTSDELTVNRLLGNIMGEYLLTKDITYSIRFGLDYLGQLNDIYVKKGNFLNPSPGATIRQDYNNNYLIENILSYNHTFKQKHRISATAGYTWQKNVGRFFQQGGTGFQFDDFGTNNLGSAAVTNANVTNKNESAIISYLGRVNYIFNDKYIVTITGRADGSSRFGENNKWGFFPSGALAWRLSREEFMANIGVISDLKLRTSYGQTGNQEIGLYNSISRMNSVISVFGNPLAAAIGYVPTSLANPDLKWEVNTQFDVGLDLSVLNNRITFTADYYKKRTDDLLANLPIPGSSGFSSILINSGSIENQGYEFSLNSVIVDNKNINWSINANAAHNNTKVLKLAVSTRQFFAPSIPSPLDRPVNIIKEGEVLSSFYGYQEDGLWTADQTAGSIMPTAKAGDIRYKDLSGPNGKPDGKIDGNDQTILGSPYPDLTWGLTSNLTVKDFYLIVFLQGVSGLKVFNSNDFMIANSLTRTSNQLSEVSDHWSTANPNPNAKYPRLSNVQLLVSDRFVQKADYLRLRNIVLGYNLPAAKMNVKWLEASRVYVSAQNLFTLTDYHGYDPEVSQTGSGSLVKGLDRGSYPANKTFTIGLNITFK